jgi:hypothetical protein
LHRRALSLLPGATNLNAVDNPAESENLIRMETTITAFQRGFKKARAEADKGQPVVITGGAVQYIFMRRHAEANPFEGLENVFGSVALGRASGKPREKIRARLSPNRHR